MFTMPLKYVIIPYVDSLGTHIESNATCFILAWPKKDSHYKTGVHTPRASLRVTMYVILWILCMADNLDNPLVTTGLEQLQRHQGTNIKFNLPR